MNLKNPFSTKKGAEKVTLESWPKPEPFEKGEGTPLLNVYRDEEGEVYRDQGIRPYFPPRSYEFERKQGMTPKSRWPYNNREYPYGYRRYPYPYEDDEGEEKSHLIFWQTAGALLLVLLVVAAFRTNSPYADQARGMIANVWQKEVSFSSLYTWYQENLGNRISLPAFGTAKPSASLAFVPPLAEGTIKKEFDAKQQPYVILASKPGADIRAVAQGIVEAVGKSDSYGQYVIVNHGEQVGKTLYGHLDHGMVKTNEWVDAGQMIGQMEKKEGASLYFGYMKNNQFVNPKLILDASSRGGTQ